MAVVLPVDQPFDLERTLRCGQGHRWRKDKKEPGWYTSVIDGDLVRIRQTDGRKGPIHFDTNANPLKIQYKLHRQFRMLPSDENVALVHALLRRDPIMKKLIDHYWGLRVMRVDLWECMVFFALARAKDIRQTHVCMDRLADYFGRSLTLGPCQRSTFPDASTIANAGLPVLQSLGLGVPSIASTILALALLVVGRGVSSLIGSLYGKLLGILTNIHEVGDKSANCVALFAVGHSFAFPVDTHISHALEDLYCGERGFPLKKRIQGRAPGHRQPTPSEVVKLRKWSQSRFGRFAGYASQFLFIHNYEN